MSPCDCEVEAMIDNAEIAASWATLRTHLEAKTRALNAEVHSYPTPIAHCDDQLPKLLEQRERSVEQLSLVDGLGPMPAGSAVAEWERKVSAFLKRADAAPDDDIEAAIRARLRSALALTLEA
ncbi:MAG: hypothetical protein ABI537_05510 [Casimicrobiaceae bacterium]